MTSSMAEVWSELQKQQISEQAVQAAVDENLPYFVDKSEDYLRAVVGQAEVDPPLLAIQATSHEMLVAAGDNASRRRSIRDRVCDAKNRDLIDDFISVPNVTALVGLLLVVLSVNVAPIIIALAVLILKIGLNEYCEGLSEEETAPA